MGSHLRSLSVPWRAVAASAVWLIVAGCSSSSDLLGPRLASAPGAAGADFDSAMARGKAHFGDGQYALSLGAFEQALRDQPDSVRALNALAATYDQLRRFDLADQYYLRAFRQAPESGDVLNNIGYSHLMRGDLLGAERYLARAAPLSPKSTVVEANLQLVRSHLQAASAAAAATDFVGGPRGEAVAELPMTPSTPRATAPPTPAGPHFVRLASGVQLLVTRPASPASRTNEMASAEPAPASGAPDVVPPVRRPPSQMASSPRSPGPKPDLDAADDPVPIFVIAWPQTTVLGGPAPRKPRPPSQALVISHAIPNQNLSLSFYLGGAAMPVPAAFETPASADLFGERQSPEPASSVPLPAWKLGS